MTGVVVLRRGNLGGQDLAAQCVAKT